MSSHNSEISLLVQQLKSGQITKKELFDKLFVLQSERSSAGGAPGPQLAASGDSGSATAAPTAQAQPPAAGGARPPADQPEMGERGAAPAPTGFGGGSISVTQLLQRQKQQQQQQQQQQPPQRGAAPSGGDRGLEASSSRFEDDEAPIFGDGYGTSNIFESVDGQNASGGDYGEAASLGMYSAPAPRTPGVAGRRDPHSHSGAGLVSMSGRAGDSSGMEGGRGDDSHLGPAGSGLRRPASAQGRAMSAGRARPRTAPGSGLRVGGGLRATHSVDDSAVGGRRRFLDSRSRAEQAELELRVAQQAECTFKPRIRTLPAHYGGVSRNYERVKFEDRVVAWQEQRAAEQERKRETQALEELDGCTFRPAINETSRAVARRSREDATGARIADRLYQQGVQLQAERERAQQEREQLEESMLSFEPRLESAALPVQPRYMEQSQRRDGERAPSGMEECTFTPRVNGPRRTMAAASVYLRRPVWERLAEAKHAADADADADGAEGGGGGGGGANGANGANGPSFRTGITNTQRMQASVLDMNSFMNTVADRVAGSGKDGGGGGGEGGVGDTKGADDGAGGERKRPETEAERRDRNRRFRKFLQRQAQMQRQKQKRVTSMKRTLAPRGKPKLCPKSVRMASETSSHSFMERLAHDAVRKQQKGQRTRQAAVNDPECTFRPAIQQTSRSMPRRSFAEMSRGDSLKRATAQRMMQQKSEEEQLAGHTFQPQLNQRSLAMAESQLKINTDPDTYLERLQRKERLEQERRRSAQEERERAEQSQCTFRPEVHEAPEYVRKIASSLQVQRKKREDAKRRALYSRPAWQ